jgi:hypothetical protein
MDVRQTRGMMENVVNEHNRGTIREDDTLGIEIDFTANRCYTY